MWIIPQGTIGVWNNQKIDYKKFQGLKLPENGLFYKELRGFMKMQNTDYSTKNYMDLKLSEYGLFNKELWGKKLSECGLFHKDLQGFEAIRK